MNTQSTFNDIQASAPKGITIATDPDLLPLLPGTPAQRTPLHRQPDGRLEFVLMAQPTTNATDVILSVPDVLGINGETQIGLSRAKRILPVCQTSMPAAAKPDECNVCKAVPEKISRQGNRPAFEVDNIRPFGPLLHKVVSSKEHIDSLKDLGLAEVRDATEQFYEIALQERKTMGELLDGLTIGMNFGDYTRSGASQAHFHYQVAGIGKANYNAGDRLGALCQTYQRTFSGTNYLGAYEQALGETGLVIAETENELALAYAPISPRFKGEVQIMLSRSQAGNILDTTGEERAALADLQRKIMQRFHRLGYQALNQVWYMTRFSTKNDFGQRLIISLCPRTSILAFYELSGNNVIDALPWETAQTLRAAEDPNFHL